MITSQQIGTPTRAEEVREITSPSRRIEENIIRALNRIKKPSTAEEITELLNRDLGAGDHPFQSREVDAWMRNSGGTVLNLYWLRTRPRR